jgi:hypothetical protein
MNSVCVMVRDYHTRRESLKNNEREKDEKISV